MDFLKKKKNLITTQVCLLIGKKISNSFTCKCLKIKVFYSAFKS